MLLNHENLGTDTLLPIQLDESCKDLLDSLLQEICGLRVPCVLSCSWPFCTIVCPVVLFLCDSGECSLHSLVWFRHCSHWSLFRSFVTSSACLFRIIRESSDSLLDSLTFTCCPLITVGTAMSIGHPTVATPVSLLCKTSEHSLVLLGSS